MHAHFDLVTSHPLSVLIMEQFKHFSRMLIRINERSYVRTFSNFKVLQAWNKIFLLWILLNIAGKKEYVSRTTSSL